MSGNLLETHLINLKVISKIPADTKVCVVEGSVVKDGAGSLQPILRFIMGDSRKRTVEAISHTVNSTIDSAESMCESIYFQPDQRKNTAYEMGRFKELYEHLRDISTSLNASQRGIANISLTYSNDDFIVSALERLLERIDGAVSKIQTLLEKHESHYASASR
jgi:hypothetical protein